MLRCLKYTSLNSKLLVIYFANFVELGGYCPKTGYFRFLSFIPNSCHKTLINVTFERGSEKVTFFPWFWYMILPTTNNELGNKTRKKEKMGVYYPGWRYSIFQKTNNLMVRNLSGKSRMKRNCNQINSNPSDLLIF